LAQLDFPHAYFQQVAWRRAVDGDRASDDMRTELRCAPLMDTPMLGQYIKRHAHEVARLAVHRFDADGVARLDRERWRKSSVEVAPVDRIRPGMQHVRPPHPSSRALRAS
jgi:hypothetical protein